MRLPPLVALLATACVPAPAGRAGLDAGSPVRGDAVAPESGADGGPDVAGVDAPHDVAQVASGSGQCATAVSVPLGDAARRIDLSAASPPGAHSIDAPCAPGDGAEVFYALAFSEPVIVYADTFGAPLDTAVFLLSGDCAPLTAPTMDGDTLCSDDACGTLQSRVVARLDPGRYKLGVLGRGAGPGGATVHLAWALAASGTQTPLPPGSTTQGGTTSGSSGNITDLSSSCLAAGPEDSYWWTTCPGEPAGVLTAATCGGATWETALELQLPGATAAACNADGCGLQAALSAQIPAGAGLRVLSVDGQAGSDSGPYVLTVTRP